MPISDWNQAINLPFTWLSPWIWGGDPRLDWVSKGKSTENYTAAFYPNVGSVLCIPSTNPMINKNSGIVQYSIVACCCCKLMQVATVVTRGVSDRLPNDMITYDPNLGGSIMDFARSFRWRAACRVSSCFRASSILLHVSRNCSFSPSKSRTFALWFGCLRVSSSDFTIFIYILLGSWRAFTFWKAEVLSGRQLMSMWHVHVAFDPKKAAPRGWFFQRVELQNVMTCHDVPCKLSSFCPYKLHELVGGIPTPLKNISQVNGKDDIPYIMENKSHVPNHQPVKLYTSNYYVDPFRGIPHFFTNMDTPWIPCACGKKSLFRQRPSDG